MIKLYTALLQRISDLGDQTSLGLFLEELLSELSNTMYPHHNLSSRESFEIRNDLQKNILAVLKAMQNEKGWINCHYRSNNKEYNPCEVDAEADHDYFYSKKLEITIKGKNRLQKIKSQERIPVESIFFVLVNKFQKFESDSSNKITRKRNLENITDEEQEKNARERVLNSIQSRQGQQKFRNDLIRTYEHCLVTGCKLIDLLEAAHIRPYSKSGTYKISNGLLLRADVHTLFDLNLISIDSTTMKVLLKPEMKFTEYACYENQSLLFPENTSHRPEKEALDEHRLKAGL